MSKIVAYRERESVDPMTGNVGILQDEWRVKKVSDYQVEDLNNAFGNSWLRHKPFASHVLEHRYIRRDKEEPWKPFDTANSFKQALEYIDDKAIPCCKELEEIQQERMRYAAEQRLQKEKEAQEKAEKEEREYHKKRSAKAFDKLIDSKDSIWAKRWNDYVSAHMHDHDFLENITKDAKFIELYQAAMDSETMPSKRKTIKTFLKYAAPYMC